MYRRLRGFRISAALQDKQEGWKRVERCASLAAWLGAAAWRKWVGVGSWRSRGIQEPQTATEQLMMHSPNR